MWYIERSGSGANSAAIATATPENFEERIMRSARRAAAAHQPEAAFRTDAPPRPRRAWPWPTVLALAAGLGAAGPAAATWSILLVDTRTGEVALGSATCLTGFDLRANTPVLITGVGGCTAQSFVDSTGQNRAFIRDHIALGTDPAQILSLLATFDTGHQTRQYGFADVQGRTATFSGTGASQWKGGRTGAVGDIVYAVQGNILTGEPVVTEAVQAIIDTPGDLAEKMMAGMEAARAMGGDGRCSCPGSPTSCGSPPASFEKSAHIAYMLIARAGDIDGAHGLYRTAGRPWATAVGDFDGDGMRDVASISIDSPVVSLYFNQTPAHSNLSIFTQMETAPAGGSGRELTAADVTGDGALDLVVAQDVLDQVSILPGDGAGGFGPAQSFAVSDDPRRLAVADFNGDARLDIAVACLGATDAVDVLLNDGAGGFTRSTIAAGGGIGDLAACDVDGDGDLDLVYPAETAGQLVIVRNTGGSFAIDGFIAVPGRPQRVIASDFDANGEVDFAVITATGNDITVVLQEGGAFESEVIALPGPPREIAAGQFSGDGSLDLVIVVATSAAELAFLEGDGAGGFSVTQTALTRLGATRPEPADLNGDGWDDLAVSARSKSGVAMIDNQGGVFAEESGFAGGDYWMTFNVANTSLADPEPVFTLRDMFDDWRTELVARPDAVQSEWEMTPATVPTGGGHTATLTFTLRDWRGMIATEPVFMPVVRHAKSSDGLSSIGRVSATGPAAFEVEITSGAGSGLDVFDVIIDDGRRPVTLMPAPTLLHACIADCDGSGSLDFFDFLCFQNGFATGDPRADCDGSGALDFFDFLCFQNAFAAGCA
jgi:hypothetical protein